jgi:hypothetical protein
MICINCGSDENGKFCSNCSQRLAVKRITLKEGWYDFWARIYGFDGMLPRTLRDLTLRGGFAAREFIRGNRARYYGPVGYFFLMITIYLLWLSMIDLQLIDFVKKVNADLGNTGGNVKREYMEAIQQSAVENFKLLSFMYVPFMALVSQRIMFRKQGLNFMEHSILPLFALGHWYWVMIVFAAILKFTGYLFPTPLEWFLNAMYFGWVYTTFVTDQSKIKLFFKGAGVYIFAFLLFIIAVMVVTAVVMIIMAMTNPDMLKDMIKRD